MFEVSSAPPFHSVEAVMLVHFDQTLNAEYRTLIALDTAVQCPLLVTVRAWPSYVRICLSASENVQQLLHPALEIFCHIRAGWLQLDA